MICSIQWEAFNLSPNTTALWEKRFLFNSYSFWTIPCLKATRGPHNLIFKIIFTSLEIQRTKPLGGPSLMSQLALIQIAASNYVSQVLSDFEGWLPAFFFFFSNNKEINEASKEMCMVQCCVTSACSHPPNLIRLHYKTCDFSYTD